MKKWIFFFPLLAFTFSAFSYTGKEPKKATVASVSRTLAFPVAGKRSTIRDKWGASRGGGIRRHKGIDIHATKGTPVVAICDGIITERASMPVGGRTLWLRSAQHGWTAYYAHLDKQLVKEGQRVRKGQVIGTVGNTGNARTTPPHLHFGISKTKGWVDPLPYVKNAPKVAAPAKKKTATKSTTKKKSTGTKKRG